jgi:hypothetical protein
MYARSCTRPSEKAVKPKFGASLVLWRTYTSFEQEYAAFVTWLADAALTLR